MYRQRLGGNVDRKKDETASQQVIKSSNPDDNLPLQIEYGVDKAPEGLNLEMAARHYSIT